MILTLVKNREKCFKALEFAPNEKRKLRESDFENKDKVDFRWFASKRKRNIPLDGTLIKDTYREEAPSNKTTALQKGEIRAYGLLVINSLEEVLKLKQNFQKIKVVTGKTSFFVIGPFCAHHPIGLNIGF